MKRKITQHTYKHDATIAEEWEQIKAFTATVELTSTRFAAMWFFIALIADYDRIIAIVVEIVHTILLTII